MFEGIERMVQIKEAILVSMYTTVKLDDCEQAIYENKEDLVHETLQEPMLLTRKIIDKNVTDDNDDDDNDDR